MINITLNGSSMYDSVTQFQQTCELNQYALIENTARLPIVCLWLAVTICSVLAIWWIILPFLENKWKHYELAREALPGIAFVCSIWLVLILMYFTLELTEQGFKDLELWLTIFATLLVLFSLWWNRKTIVNFIKKLREDGLHND